MRKKLTAILIALTIAVSLLPMPVMAAVSDDETAVIKEAVTKMVTDYAAQVYRPNSDDEAFDAYLKHGLYGNGKDMVLNESSPMVSALFNSRVFQTWLIEGLTNSIVLMQNVKQSSIKCIGGPSWHNYGYRYMCQGYLDGGFSPENYLGATVSKEYKGPANENDQVMELLVGDCRQKSAIRETQRKDGTVVYAIDLYIYDRFDFTTDYEDLKDSGYDTSQDQDLVNLGYLLTFVGLDEFDWEFCESFQVEVPIRCDHGAHNYHWTFDGDSISMISEGGDGYSSNPAAKKVYEYENSDGETVGRIYHELQESVVLRHDCPWVLELDRKADRSFIFSPRTTLQNSVFPSIYMNTYEYVWLYFYEEDFDEDGKAFYTTHYLGVKTVGEFKYNAKHLYTYTLENKVSADGSNMIYLTIYDNDLGEVVLGPAPMDDHWIKADDVEKRSLVTAESDKANGLDIIINYLGNKNSGLGTKNTVMDLRVWENGKDAVPDAGVYTAPTCTDKGGYLHNCHKCGQDYLTQAEAALGHDFGEYVDDNNTTCTEDGTKTRVCATCGEKDTVTIEGSVLDHSYGDYTDDGNTTCTVDGTETRTCDRCGNTETRTMDGSAQGHKYGAYQFDHNSTCTADGTMTAVCEVCGEKDVVAAEGSATGHNHKAVVTAPTCTEQGYTTYTCHCGDSYVDDYTEPTPHKEITLPAIPSTCVEKGKTEGKQCELCGEITVPQTSTAYGNHTWDAGTVIKQPTLTEPGTLMYTCVNCSKTSHMSITEMPQNGFDDVPADAYYAAAVAWAKVNGITSGLSETLFGSDMSCTRGQVVTFLWAAAGRPEPKTTNNPFTDVTNSDYFYKPVLWAVENGITGGIGDGLFGPHETCTRGQIVTFLWASQGKPASGSSTFTDVADTDWYAKSVAWAAENQVTGGIGNNMFGPNNTCTRAQVVTFLYKVYG